MREHWALERSPPLVLSREKGNRACARVLTLCPWLRDFDHIGQLLLSGRTEEMSEMCLCVSLTSSNAAARVSDSLDQHLLDKSQGRGLKQIPARLTLLIWSCVFLSLCISGVSTTTLKPLPLLFSKSSL